MVRTGSGWSVCDPCLCVLSQEQEQMQCYNQRMIELLKARQQQEKNRLPKIQRSEAKTRMAMFKKSLRIHSSGSSAEDREKTKQVKQVSGGPYSVCPPLRDPHLSLSLCSVLQAGGEEAEGRALAPAAETREPDEGEDQRV